MSKKSDDLTNVEEGLIDLADLTFNFDEYFERHRRRELSEIEQEEFDARVIGLFCKSVWESRIDKWAANYLAEKLLQVLAGEKWNNALPLPWAPREDWLNEKGQRAMEIYCAIENARRALDSFNVTTLLAEQATKRCVSYETARGDYYAIKKAIDAGGGIPKRFLKSDTAI